MTARVDGQPARGHLRRRRARRLRALAEKFGPAIERHAAGSRAAPTSSSRALRRRRARSISSCGSAAAASRSRAAPARARRRRRVLTGRATPARESPVHLPAARCTSRSRRSRRTCTCAAPRCTSSTPSSISRALRARKRAGATPLRWVCVEYEDEDGAPPNESPRLFEKLRSLGRKEHGRGRGHERGHRR